MKMYNHNPYSIVLLILNNRILQNVNGSIRHAMNNELYFLRCIPRYNKASVLSWESQETSITVQAPWNGKETSTGRAKEETSRRIGEEENGNTEETRSRRPAGKYLIGSLCGTYHTYFELLLTGCPAVTTRCQHMASGDYYLNDQISDRSFRGSFRLFHFGCLHS